MYPTIQEKAIVDAAEKIMFEAMARYDPSHDKYHGQLLAQRESRKADDLLD